MKVSELVRQLVYMQERYGDLEIAIDVESESQVFELSNLIEWDVFEPGHEGYIVLTTEWQEV